MNPIYYVIAESKPVSQGQLSAYQILKVFSCDLDDISFLYAQELRPLYGTKRDIVTFIFHREPANQLKGMAQEVKHEKNG